MRLRLACFVLLLAAFARAQNAVDMKDEPHHQLLLKNEFVRVFQVEIPAHESTALTAHQHTFLMITLQDSELGMAPDGNSTFATFRYSFGDVHFTYAGHAITLRNEGAATYRNLTVELLKPGATTYGYQWQSGNYDFGAQSLPGPVPSEGRFSRTLNLQNAFITDVRLMPGDVLPPRAAARGELVVALSSLDLATTDAPNPSPALRIDKSRVEWLPHGTRFQLANLGPAPARFVLVDLK